MNYSATVFNSFVSFIHYVKSTPLVQY